METFDPGLFLWTLATFAGLMMLLARFAFRPLRELLRQREAAIQGAMQTAEQAREDARKLLETQQAELATARSQVRDLIDEGHRLAAELQREADVRNREESEHMLRQAREEIERETRKHLDDLKGTVATLSVRVARQMIREHLDEDRHRQLADEFIERLKQTRHERQRRTD